MFAYVKFNKTCTRHKEKHIVPVSSITHFDVKNIGNRNKSYKVKCGASSYCTGVIIFVEDTMEKLNAKISTKRPTCPPKALIQSASESASESEAAARGKKQTLKVHNEVRLKEAIDGKTKELVMEQTSAKNEQKSKGAVKRKAGSGTKTLTNGSCDDKQDAEVVTPTVKKIKQHSTGTKTLTDGYCHDKQDAEVVTPTVKKINQHSSGGINKENESPKVFENKSEHQKPAMKGPQKTTMYTECNNSEHYGLVEEIKFLEEKCERSDKKLTDQEFLIKELTTLNIQLQRDVIQYFDEFKAMAKQYEGAVRNLEGADTPPPGFNRKSDQTIHLGRNVWIPKSKYNYIVRVAKSNQLFVKEMAVAVFGLEVLQNSSVTGTKCNRFKDREAKPALDDVKILAIQDIFRHWLMTNKNCTECEAQLESGRTQRYITAKISDLTRASTKASSAATESSEGEEGEEEKGDDEGEPLSEHNDAEEPLLEQNDAEEPLEPELSEETSMCGEGGGETGGDA